MSNHLDLEEQEQIEQLKAFWAQYGNAITWGLIAIFAAFAAWNGYQYWQRQQAQQASALYDEVERMVGSGDPAKLGRAFEDMKNRYPGTVYAQQAALLVAEVSVAGGRLDDAKGPLRWAAEQGKDSAIAAVARLRLASVQIESKDFDGAIAVLATEPADSEYQGLFQDRRGDALAAKGDKAGAIESYKKVLGNTSANPDLQRLVRIKLNGLGTDMEPVAASASKSVDVK